MPRAAREVEGPLAAQLVAAAEVMELNLTQANIAAGRLAELLAEGKAEGYSVRALAEASGLSPKRVRLLLSG